MDDDPEAALVAELRALAWPKPRGRNDFTIVHDHIPIFVDYVTGSSKSGPCANVSLG
jgi:hypothetical protein